MLVRATSAKACIRPFADARHGVLQCADRLAAQDFIAFVHRFERVTHAAFAEELWLAEIRIPARAVDPAAHHVAAARHQIGIVRRRAGNQGEDFIAHLFGAALVGIQAEHPVVFAGLDGAVAQIAEAVEWHLDHPRAQRSAISAVRSTLNESITTTSSAHSTLETAASIFSASL